MNNTVAANGSKSFVKKNSSLILCIILIVILFVMGNAITGGQFASVGSTVKFAALIAIFGLGQMLIICTGGDIDLSVGYTATLVSCVTAGMMDGSNMNIWKAILFALMVGVVVGLVNGFMTIYARIPSLVVTLAMSQILQGIVDIYSAGASIGGEPRPCLKWLAGQQTGPIPNIGFLLAIMTVAVMWLLYKTKLSSLYVATGANPRTAHLSGVKVNFIRMSSFVVCSIIAAMMGLILLGNLGMAFKDMASTYVMPSIAAVVIGGVSIKGGQRNYIGVILGAIVLQTLTNLFVALGYGDSGKYLGSGIILLLMLIVYVREKTSR